MLTYTVYASGSRFQFHRHNRVGVGTRWVFDCPVRLANYVGIKLLRPAPLPLPAQRILEPVVAPLKSRLRIMIGEVGSVDRQAQGPIVTAFGLKSELHQKLFSDVASEVEGRMIGGEKHLVGLEILVDESADHYVAILLPSLEPLHLRFVAIGK